MTTQVGSLILGLLRGKVAIVEGHEGYQYRIKYGELQFREKGHDWSPSWATFLEPNLELVSSDKADKMHNPAKKVSVDLTKIEELERQLAELKAQVE